jgi:hypothetical protein
MISAVSAFPVFVVSNLMSFKNGVAHGNKTERNPLTIDAIVNLPQLGGKTCRSSNALFYRSFWQGL